MTQRPLQRLKRHEYRLINIPVGNNMTSRRHPAKISMRDLGKLEP
jgi:hypothetical protein